MANRLTDARNELAALLTGIMPSDKRLHAFPPAQLVTPCIFIDMPRVAVSNVSLNATFPVYAVFDGKETSQTAAMDQVAALVWDALVGHPDALVSTIEPDVIDVGGVQTRALRFEVLFPVALETLCYDAQSIPSTV